MHTQNVRRFKVTTNKTVRILTAPDEVTARDWAQIVPGEKTQSVEEITKK